ncbi:hypothetical protein [Psychroserpens sp. MEBiC05023]
MKKNSKNLKTLLKISALTLIIVFNFSCEDSCDEKFIEVIKDAEENNQGKVLEFLENGGSAVEACYNYKSGKLGNYITLLDKSILLKNLDLLHMILDHEDDISDYGLSRILRLALEQKDVSLTKKLIEKEAHLSHIEKCDILELVDIQLLSKLKYEFNYQDSYLNNTLLMNIVQCNATDENDILFYSVKYLVEEVNVKTDIKNKDGKTAEELAVNPKIKTYLESL